jgi:hypothetical protein
VTASRRVLSAVVAGACLALAACSDATPAAAPALSLHTTPALDPGFSAGVPDYTLRCPDRVVKVHAQVPPGRTVTIDGKAASGSVDQQVTLAPGQAFKIQDGSTTHYVRCTPGDFPRWKVQRRGKPVSRWIAFAPTEREQPPRGAPYSVIADGNGVPVWWARADGATPLTTTVLPDATVAWARLGGPFSQTYWDHVKLNGGALPHLETVGEGADHHDFQPLPNGNHLMIAYRPRYGVDLRRFGGPRDATVFDGEVQELTPDGKLVWSWSTEGHVKLRETASWRFKQRDFQYRGKPAFDLIHMNSVEFDGPNLLVSGKNVNAVYLVRRSDGKILWKLGGTHRAESLRIQGDRYGQDVFDGQHDARMQRDGTVSLHDNGTFKHHRLPRIVRYRINRRAHTARLVQRFTDKRVGHSYCCGSAQRLAHGHWLIDWGANPYITEVGPRGRRVLSLKLPDKLFSYRAQSVPPGILTRDALRAGMDAAAGTAP